MKDGWRNNCWTLLVLWEECVAAESGSSVGFPRCLVNDTTPDKAAEEQECVIGRLRPLSVAFTWLSTLASSVIAKTTASDQLSLERNQKNLWVVPLLLLLLMNSPPTVTHTHTDTHVFFLAFCINPVDALTVIVVDCRRLIEMRYGVKLWLVADGKGKLKFEFF